MRTQSLLHFLSTVWPAHTTLRIVCNHAPSIACSPQVHDFFDDCQTNKIKITCGHVDQPGFKAISSFRSRHREVQTWKINRRLPYQFILRETKVYDGSILLRTETQGYHFTGNFFDPKSSDTVLSFDGAGTNTVKRLYASLI